MWQSLQLRICSSIIVTEVVNYGPNKENYIRTGNDGPLLPGGTQTFKWVSETLIPSVGLTSAFLNSESHYNDYNILYKDIQRIHIHQTLF